MENYTIVTSSAFKNEAEARVELIKAVSTMQRLGWSLQGGVSMALTQHEHGGVITYNFAQAMVKEG